MIMLFQHLWRVFQRRRLLFQQFLPNGPCVSFGLPQYFHRVLRKITKGVVPLALPSYPSSSFLLGWSPDGLSGPTLLGCNRFFEVWWVHAHHCATFQKMQSYIAPAFFLFAAGFEHKLFVCFVLLFSSSGVFENRTGGPVDLSGNFDSFGQCWIKVELNSWFWKSKVDRLVLF